MALTSPTRLEASVRNHVLGTVACRTGQTALVANGNAQGPGRGVAAIVPLEVNWVLDAGAVVLICDDGSGVAQLPALASERVLARVAAAAGVAAVAEMAVAFTVEAGVAAGAADANSTHLRVLSRVLQRPFWTGRTPQAPQADGCLGVLVDVAVSPVSSLGPALRRRESVRARRLARLPQT